MKPVSILIISKRPQDLEATTAFLNKRGYKVAVKDNLREGIGYLAKHPPEWVFVSINASPTISKFQNLIRQTFKIEAVLFSDAMDIASLSRLNQMPQPLIATRLTGPAIITFFAQSLAAANATEARRRTVGVKRSSFDHNVHIKGEGAGTAGSTKIAHDQLSPRLTTANETASSTLAPNSGAVAVDQLEVLVRNDKNAPGYMVLAGNGSQATIGAAKARLKSGEWSVLGSIKTQIDNLANWAAERTQQVRMIPSAEGDVLTCFVPEAQPLPNFSTYKADENKLELPFADIPVETGMPCPLYVHLPHNDKFICLIKEDGHLSLKQKQKLEGMGVPNLLIEKIDAERYKIFYVRQKLTAAP